MNIKLTEVQIEFIKNNYGKIKRKEISQILNIKEYKVKQCASMLNLKSNIYTSKNVNHDSFSNFSLETCYWAGFIAADGCLTDKNHLMVCLSQKDIKHLKKLKQYLNSEHKIYISKKTTNCTLSIKSKKISNDLNKNFNITIRKSLTLNPPLDLNKDQSLSFIIGYIDGDGSIGFNGKYLRLRIIGTDNFLNWIRNILGGQNRPIKHCNSRISIISFKRRVINFLNQYRKDKNLPVLDRKWSKCEEDI